jgi:protocatechuate 3,4-dioxygenase beta subunit
MCIARTSLMIPFAALLWAQGTVVFSGRVTDAATAQPIEGAAITLEQGNSHGSRLTDSAGNFSFEDDIVPGPGRVQIQKDGYILFQRSNPDESSLQITGDRSEHNFKLTPASSITGRITSEDGVKPVVTLLQEDFTGGVARFIVAASTNPSFVSGPDGSFRFVGLEPGRYIVSASAQPAVQPFIGELLCQQGVCTAVTRAEQEQTANAPTEGYVTTYYPGATQFADALPVTLASGEKRAMDFRIAKRPLFRVSGEIEASDLERAVFMSFKKTDGGPGESASVGRVLIPGPFGVGPLPAGQYSGTVAGMQGNISFAITDHDVSGLKWILRPAQRQLTVDGSFRMATTGTALPAGLSVQFAWPLPGESTPTPASGNGYFRLTALPGDYSVLPVAPSGYAATELRYGGANYLNSLIPMNGDSIDSSLTVVLSDQPGTVGGSILDGEQKPIPAKVVLVPDPLPPNFDLWAIRVVSTDKDGTFAFRGLAPGRYKAVALTGDARRRDHDFAILGDKLSSTEAFEIVAGQSLSVNVRPF